MSELRSPLEVINLDGLIGYSYASHSRIYNYLERISFIELGCLSMLTTLILFCPRATIAFTIYSFSLVIASILAIHFLSLLINSSVRPNLMLPITHQIIPPIRLVLFSKGIYHTINTIKRMNYFIVHSY